MDSVRFEPLDSAGSWLGISIGQIAPNCTLSYTIIYRAIRTGSMILGAGMRINQLPTRRIYLIGCKFEANRAIASGMWPTANGGAICVNDGRIEIKNCLFIENTASDCGGAIYCHGGSAGELQIENSIFECNSIGSWGGIAIHPSFDMKISLNECVFRQNTGKGDVVWARDTTIVENCIFESNIVNSGNYTASALHVSGYGCIRNCQFIDNEFPSNYSNGAIVVRSGHMAYIDSCVFSGNTSANYGTSIATKFSDNTIIVRNCIFENNETTDKGGVIYLEDDSDELEIENCTFTNNVANKGGVIHTVSSNVSVRNSLFQGNSADSYGGAIYGGGSYCSCLFMNNSAQEGGAIYGSGLPNDFTNCVFFDNEAIWYGGTFSLHGNNLTIINSIIDTSSANEGGVINIASGNANFVNSLITYGNAGYQGGIARFDYGTSSNLTFFNSIILDANAPEGELVADDGGTDNLNIIASYYDTTWSIAGGGLTIVAESLTTVYPDFEGTGENPWMLIEGSSAIDAGLEEWCSLEAPDSDILGIPRPWGDAWDIGPHEYRDTTAIEESKLLKPDELSLTIFPNPFNSSCAIIISSGATVEIYDLNGKCVRAFDKTPVIWQPVESISSGIYLVRTRMEDGRTASKKVMYLK